MPPTGNMQLGYRCHLALEADAKSSRPFGPLHWVVQVYGAEVLARPEYADEIRKEQVMAETMISGYMDWAAETGLDEGIEVIAAEGDVQAPMPGMPGVTIRGRLDQIIRRVADGVCTFRDWKTTGTLAVRNNLHLSPQMRFYTMLQRLSAKGNDPRVEGGQVVYLLRSKRTVRATPPFYALEEARYNRDVLNATYQRTRAVITEMLEARRQLDAGGDHHEIVYPSPMGSCDWDCPFLSMCALMDDGSRWQDMAASEFIRESPYAYYDRPDILAKDVIL